MRCRRAKWMVWLAEGIPGFGNNIGMQHHQRMDAVKDGASLIGGCRYSTPMHDLYCMQHGFQNLSVAEGAVLSGEQLFGFSKVVESWRMESGE